MCVAALFIIAKNWKQTQVTIRVNGYTNCCIPIHWNTAKQLKGKTHATTHNATVESQRYYAVQNKSDTKDYIQYDSMCKKFENRWSKSVLLEVRCWWPLREEVIDREGAWGSLLGWYHLKNLDLGSGYTGVYKWKIHQAVHLRSVHFNNYR